MAGMTAWVQKNTPLTLTSRTRRHSDSWMDSKAVGETMPALLTRMSRRPKRSVTAADHRVD